MSEVLRAGAQLIRNIRKNKAEIPQNRKTLQALQPSATDYNQLVPSPSMVSRVSKDVAVDLDSTFTIPSLEKENSSVVRLSKRKNVVLDEQLKKGSSKEDAAPATKSRKAKSSKIVSKSKKAPVAKKLSDDSQGRLDSFVSVTSNSKERGELNMNMDNCTLVNEGILNIEPKFTIPDVDSAEKENPFGSRRSKRKNAVSDEQPKIESPKECATRAIKSQKSKSSKAVSKNKKDPVAKKAEKKLPDVNQSSLNSFVSVTSKSNEEESTIDMNNCTLVNEDLTVCVHESVSKQVDLLTSDAPSETYWKDIAEQRRLALEQALYENAQLVDQLEVVEAENGQLKSLLEECEKVIGIVNASV